MANRLQIYNASAGSGKTYTLVQEYLRIVLGGDNKTWRNDRFKQVLAMTFTNKAAQEMKDRVLIALKELSAPANEKQNLFLLATAQNIGQSPPAISERAKEVLNQIIHHYGQFSVMTLDKFTHKIIRTFSRELNLSMDFDIEMDEEKLRREATDLLFDEIGKSEEITQLITSYAQENLENEKKWDFSNSLFEFSKKIFDEGAQNALSKLSNLSFEDFAKAKDRLNRYKNLYKETLIAFGEAFFDIVATNGLNPEDFYHSKNGPYSFFKHCKEGPEQIEKMNSHLLKAIDKEDFSGSGSQKSLVQSNNSALLSLGQEVVSFFEKEFPRFVVCNAILKELSNLTLLKDIVQKIEVLKSEQNVLLISDFHRLISDIIVNEPIPFIYERLGVRYNYFLLDEFQDTSHLQWINTIPLIHNSLSSGHQNLIVGDGKQAIYRWRNGEVRQFIQLPDKIYNPREIATLKEAESKFQDEGHLTELKTNYRSAPEIIDFNNQLFNAISSDKGEFIKEIYQSVEQLPFHKHSGYVKLDYKEESQSTEGQLAFIEDSIQQSLNAGFELKDICVIVRKNRHGALIASHLTDLGLNVTSEDSLYIGNDLTVKFIFNTLCAIVSPKNNNYRIKSMEQFCRLILQIAPFDIISKTPPNQTILEFFKAHDYSPGTPDDHLNLYEFIEHLILSFGLDISNNPFMQFFLEKVYDFERTSPCNVREFIQWFSDTGRYKSIQSPTGANAVKILTIHKSKGLQFPVVISPFMSWKQNVANNDLWIEEGNEELPAFLIKAKKEIAATEFHDLYEKENEETILDDLNLIYVAFTRPENALFISFDKKDQTINKWFTPLLEELFDSNTNEIYEKGKLQCPAKKTEETTKVYPIHFIPQTMGRPELSFETITGDDLEEIQIKRDFGTAVHLVLSVINAKEDVASQLDKLIHKGKIDPSWREAIFDHINGLFEDPHFQQYFVGEALTEQAIINKKGRMYIPDRMIIEGSSLKIVDFKTGNQRQKDVKQVLGYIQLAQELGYSTVRGEIYYTDDRQVVPV